MNHEPERQTHPAGSGPNSNPGVNDRPQEERKTPFGDARDLYEIPHPHPDDPPYRDWWIDDDRTPSRER